MNGGMSASGTKRTSACAMHMSAYEQTYLHLVSREQAMTQKWPLVSFQTQSRCSPRRYLDLLFLFVDRSDLRLLLRGGHG